MRFEGKRILLTLCFTFATPDVSGRFSQGVPYAGTATKTFYAATNGNDQWSGTLPLQNLTGTDGPFATLQHARNAIRDLRNRGSKDAFTVLVRGGTYELNETLVLGPEDSGTESKPLTIKAFNNEHPILSGSKTVKNFLPFRGKIYQADLGSKFVETDSFSQLFAAGKRQILARHPNFDSTDPIHGGFLYVENPKTIGSRREFTYRDDLMPSWINPKDSTIVIYPGDNWGKNTLQVFSMDRKSRIITLSKETSAPIKPYNRYYIQNTLKMLDSPGEWFFDRRMGKLYYWPPNDEALQSAAIPSLQSIVTVTGSDIQLEGFTLEGSESSAIIVNGATRTVIGRNTIFNAGGRGVEISNGFGNIAVGNDIHDVLKEGILVSGGDQLSLTAANNRAENNYIHHVGTGSSTSSAIACRGVGNVVSHNLIHSTPRAGVWLEGNEHLVEYNDVHHVNQETQDSGIIYFGQISWVKRGNILRFNYLHDSGGYGLNTRTGQWQSPFDTNGIYMDDWTSGTMVYGNIIKDTVYSGIFIHGGRDNIVENNMVIEGGTHQIVLSSWPPGGPIAQNWLPKMFAEIKPIDQAKYPRLITISDVATGAKMSGNRIVGNIFYSENQSTLLYGIYNDIDLVTTVVDYNTIFHGGAAPVTRYLHSGKPWSEWQAMGFDKRSFVADPLFADIKDSNFTLSSDSPAVKMGFKPFPFEAIGPYPDALRASWPVVPNWPPPVSSGLGPKSTD